MQKVVGLFDYLKENTFYTTQLEKDTFTADEKSVMDAFFFSFVGWVSLLASAKNRVRVKTYFKSDKKLRLSAIDDSNNDTSLIVKIMADGSYFKTVLTPTQITRFLVKARQGQIDDVDPNILRGWLGEIKPDKLLKANVKVRKSVDDFMNGGTLGKLANDLRVLAKRDKRFKTTEFVSMSKGLQIDVDAGATPGANTSTPAATTTPAPAAATTPVAKDSSSSAVWSPSDIIGATAAANASAPKRRGRPPKNANAIPSVTAPAVAKVDKPAPTPAPAPVVLKKYEGVSAAKNLWSEFQADKKASEIDKEYEFSKANINHFLETLYGEILDENSLVFERDAVLETTKFFQNHKTDISYGVLGAAIFPPFRASTLTDKKIIAFNITSGSGIIKLYDIAPTREQLVLMDQMIDLLATRAYESKTLTELENAIKIFKDDYLSSPLFAYHKNNDGFIGNFGNFGASYRTPYRMVRSLMVLDNPLEGWLKIGVITKVDGDYVFRPAKNLDYKISSALYELGEKLGVKQPGNYEEVLDQLKKGADYSGYSDFAWDKADALKGIDLEKLKKDIKDGVPNFNDWVKNILSINDTLHENNRPIIDWAIESYDVEANKQNLYRESLYRIDYIALKIAEKTLNWIVESNFNIASAQGPTFYRNDATLGAIYSTLTKNNAAAANYANLVKASKNNVFNIIREYEKDRNYYGYSRATEFGSLKNNPFASLWTKKDQDEIDEFILSKVVNSPQSKSAPRYWNSILEKAPISPWSSLNASNKELFKKLLKVGDPSAKIFGTLSQYIDINYFNELSQDDFMDMFQNENINNVTRLTGLEKDEKVEVFDRFVSDQKGLDTLLNEESFPSYSYMDIITSSKKLENKTYGTYVQKMIDEMKNRGNRWYWGYLSQFIDKVYDVDEPNDKALILLEKSLTGWDTSGISKRTKEYQNFMTSAQPAFIKYVDKNRKAANAAYTTYSLSMQKRLAAQYLESKEFALNAGSAIVSESQPIRPFDKLDDKRIKEILKYNNVVSEETKVPAKHIKNLDTLDNYAKNFKPAKAIEDLQITPVEMTNKEMLQLTVRMHQTKRNEKHGPEGLLFKRAFNVRIPMQVKAHEEWIANDPKQQIINPMYHGTGSIAASMILRYGFRVIKSGDKSVVGRMLGDGVYGAIHVDKSQQYIGDAGYARTVGMKGYIFEMDAALGKEGKDYRSAGLGRDSIKSPEWAVFTPNSQFLILRAYEVQIVSAGTMRNIIAENPLTTNEESGIMSFKSFIREQNEMIKNYTRYTFVNGYIPISTDDYVDFEEFKSTRDNIWLEPSAYGPTVVIEGTEESNNYLFTGPTDFKVNHEELFEEYIRLLKGV